MSGDEIVLKIEGVDLPDTSGFVAERWHNDEGASGWRGDVRSDANGWWMHEQAWVAFEVDLPAGDYDIEVKLPPHDNNVNESMRAELSLQAVDHQDQTVTAKQVKKQMEAFI